MNDIISKNTLIYAVVINDPKPTKVYFLFKPRVHCRLSIAIPNPAGLLAKTERWMMVSHAHDLKISI